MENGRLERDAMGTIAVAQERLWGAQTQRSLLHFKFAGEVMPTAVIYALVVVKRAAASVNAALNLMDKAKADAIIIAADEVLAGKHPHEFPLVVWQTGSGTQSNMNVNEVLANRATQLLGGTLGEDKVRLVHPNDDVNMGQSSNDVFPTAMNIAAVAALQHDLLPAVQKLRTTLHNKAQQFAGIIKLGRTHLQDATPLTLGQEFSGYVAQLDHSFVHLSAAMPHLHELAIGGTAVGTGLNTHPQFGQLMAQEIAQITGSTFCSAPNKFAALAASDPLIAAHAAMKTLAVALFKIANDLRWLGSGPRAGIGEISLPENEPGSSIMPGKVNPTQAESLTMICCQVFGNDVAVTFGGASGNFELNVYRPMLIRNFLHSANLLASGCTNFETYCVADIIANTARIEQLMQDSLMLVTALNSHIGYDNAARIAKHAHQHGTTLKAAALILGLVSAADFDAWVKPENMV